ALVAESSNHQVRGAVHDLRPVREAGCRIDEAAEPHHADYLVEVAEPCLDLGEEIDRAGASRELSAFDGHFAAKPALADQFSLRVEADLAGNDHEISGAYERNVVGDRCFWLRQG